MAGRWNKERVVAAIRARHERGLPLSTVWRHEPSLYAAGKFHFGRCAVRCWRLASRYNSHGNGQNRTCWTNFAFCTPMVSPCVMSVLQSWALRGCSQPFWQLGQRPARDWTDATGAEGVDEAVCHRSNPRAARQRPATGQYHGS